MHINMKIILRIFLSLLTFASVTMVTFLIHIHNRYESSTNFHPQSATTGVESVVIDRSRTHSHWNTSIPKLSVIVDNGTNSSKINTKNETLLGSLTATHCPKVADGNSTNSTTSQTFCPRKEKQYSIDFKTIISPAGVCNRESPLHVDVLFLVLSVHQHQQNRDAIRNTWGSVQKNHTWPQNNSPITEKIGVIFLIGQNGIPSEETDLQKEANTTGDILQFNVQDSYFNLTLKVLFGLKWVTSQCPSVSLVAKCDDDIFINLVMMLKHINAKDMNNTIAGFVLNNALVYRGGKHAVSKAVLPDEMYPPYALGILYVISKTVAHSIVRIAEYMPYVNIEDAFITGILGRVVGATHKHIPTNLYNISRTATVCEFFHNMKMLSKDVKPELAEEIWTVLTSNKTCVDNGNNLRHRVSFTTIIIVIISIIVITFAIVTCLPINDTADSEPALRTSDYNTYILPYRGSLISLKIDIGEGNDR